LSFQEYFGKPGTNPSRWGKPVAALLGALQAQLDLGVAAIGGKDSMSGSFESLDVPPTLVSFAVAIGKTDTVVSPEFKQAGSRVALLCPVDRADGLPEADSQRRLFEQVYGLIASKQARAVYAPGVGGVLEAVFKMCLGNGLGFAFSDEVSAHDLFSPRLGAFVLELAPDCAVGVPLGTTTTERVLVWHGERAELGALEDAYTGALEDVFPTRKEVPTEQLDVATVRINERAKPRTALGAKPTILIPVFPGTNCEYESARAVERAGAKADLLVLQTHSAAAMQESLGAFAARLSRAQALFLPGGFSNGDEPDGSGKFITAFLRHPLAADAIADLLERRDGLALGICNGFQALIKLGLLPYGRMTQPAAGAPTLTLNAIGRHQSRIVRTRITSNLSPWLMLADADELYSMPVSHGEGRFFCEPEVFSALAGNGQIAAQYVDENGKPTMDVRFNPSGSYAAVEAITSPDGRILGKMGHSERIGRGLYQNVPGNYDMRLFASAVRYFA